MSNGYGRSTDGFGIDRQQSVDLIVKTALENGVNDPRQIAYMLATAQHETRNFTAPDEDFGRSQARKLGYSGGENYFGRGYVHLTHDYNYAQFDQLLGLNGVLVRNPEMAKEPEIAAKILVIGMRDGLFRGVRLDRYIDHDTHDLYNARRTVNGIVQSKSWTIKAAKDCQRYAEDWERKVPDLIEKVQRDGVDLSRHEPLSHNAAATLATNAVLKLGTEGQQVRDLQEQLAKLGYVGKNGQPLALDGKFGSQTEHAVREFQTIHGLKPVDGIAGSQTMNALEQARQQPLITEATHPNHALYQTIAQKLPAGTDPKVVANVTLQAMENGIDAPGKVGVVHVSGSNVHVLGAGNDPGLRSRTDLNAPTADLQEMSDHMARETAQQQQQLQQQQRQQQHAHGFAP